MAGHNDKLLIVTFRVGWLRGLYIQSFLNFTEKLVDWACYCHLSPYPTLRGRRGRFPLQLGLGPKPLSDIWSLDLLNLR